MNLLSTAPCRYLVMLALLASPLASQADAFLEVSEFSTAQKKVLPLTSDEPKLFNIEFFSGWSHCEVAAGFKQSSRQSFAWLRCFSLDDAQVALTCLGTERQTIVLGHKDDSKKERGSLALVCNSD